MRSNRLFKRLQDEEEKVFGVKTYPITSNISEYLIPVAETLLNRIPAFMPEYTSHDINHCKAVLNNISSLLPSSVELNIVELTILIHAVLLHDIGMVINTKESEEIKKSADFEKMLFEYDKGTLEDDILTEYIRRTHVERSRDYIDCFKINQSTYKIIFDFKGIDLSDWVKNVIESHSLSTDCLRDPDKYPTNKLIVDYSVNIQFLSILLRLGDILDFDIFRTPYFLYKHINPENKISIDEWEKHLSIEGKKIDETSIIFEAKCSSSKIERSVRHFVDWIEYERKKSIDLLANNSSSHYKLNLKDSVSLKVRNDGSYIYSDLMINLDYKKVLHILMGTELYDTPDVFIRELIQNAYDACKYRQEIAFIKEDAYEPKIVIEYESLSNCFLIEDNGIGMNYSTIENYVLKIGNSYYKSKSFEKEKLHFTPISNFGIGILSCFMVSDIIEIESYKYEKGINKNDPVHCTLYLEDRFIDIKPSKKSSFGTKIKLKLHDAYVDKLKIKSIADIIQENTAHQKIPIKLIFNKEESLLNEKAISIPEEYKAINDIVIIEFENVSWLEGFIVIHKNQHQGIIEPNKISQQGFAITTKARNNIALNISWLQFCKFFINILPENKLNLKASRNSVIEDDKLANLRTTIIETVVDFFSDPVNKLILPQFLDCGRGRVFSGSNKEFNFLIGYINFNILHIQSNQINLVNFKNVIDACKDKTSFIVISPHLLHNVNKNPGFIDEIKNYDYLVFAENTIQYFYQFSEPFTVTAEIIVSDIPGIVYNKLIIRKSKELTVDLYGHTYNWYRNYDISHNLNYEDIFCVVNNNQYNFLDIQINEKHVLGKLLKNTEKIFYSKRFVGSLKTNITTSVLNNVKLDKYVALNGESHFMVNNFLAYSLNTIGIMKDTFLESLNVSIKCDLLMPLVTQGLIAENDIDKYLLDVSDFPVWWVEQK